MIGVERLWFPATFLRLSNKPHPRVNIIINSSGCQSGFRLPCSSEIELFAPIRLRLIPRRGAPLAPSTACVSVVRRTPGFRIWTDINTLPVCPDRANGAEITAGLWAERRRCCRIKRGYAQLGAFAGLCVCLRVVCRGGCFCPASRSRERPRRRRARMWKCMRSFNSQSALEFPLQFIHF